MSVDRPTVALGAALAFVGVAIGAFGAHALREVLDRGGRAVYETGVHYHLFHALAVVVLGTIARGEEALLRACRLMALGVLLFAGSLYVLAVSGVRAWGAVTPFGGVAFLWAWLGVVTWGLRSQPQASES